MFASVSADLPGYSDGPVDPHLSSQQPRGWGWGRAASVLVREGCVHWVRSPFLLVESWNR